MNRKAFITGTGILSPLIIIGSVVLMALFLVLVSSITALKNPSNLEANYFTPSESSILWQPIEFTLNDNSQRKSIVIDALVEATLAEIKFKQTMENSLANYMILFKESLKEKLEAENQNVEDDICFILIQSSPLTELNTIAYKIKKGKAEPINQVEINIYQDYELPNPLPIFTAEKFGVSSKFEIKLYYDICENVF